MADPYTKATVFTLLLALSMFGQESSLVEVPIDALAMSSDGRVVVGRTRTEPKEAVMWSQVGGVQKLLGDPGEVTDVSADGSVFLIRRSDGGWYVKRGTAEPTLVMTDTPAVTAITRLFLGDDGQVVFATHDREKANESQPVRKADRFVTLEMPKGAVEVWASLARSGKQFFGAAQFGTVEDGNLVLRAALWDEEGKVKLLSEADSIVTAVGSEPGLVGGAIGNEAVVWKGGSVVRRFPIPAGFSKTLQFSDLKSAIYRSKYTQEGVTSAFATLPDGKTLPLAEYLATKDIRLPGAQLEEVQDVTPDGKTLLVSGRSKEKKATCWRIQLP